MMTLKLAQALVEEDRAATRQKREQIFEARVGIRDHILPNTIDCERRDRKRSQNEERICEPCGFILNERLFSTVKQDFIGNQRLLHF